MCYKVKEVAARAVKLGSAHPLAVPTALDAEPYEVFHPSPREQDYGRTLNLAGYDDCDRSDLPTEAPEWPLLDRALLDWLKARRANADGLLGRPGGVERFIRETGEAFRAAWRLELPESSAWGFGRNCSTCCAGPAASAWTPPSIWAGRSSLPPPICNRAASCASSGSVPAKRRRSPGCGIGSAPPCSALPKPLAGQGADHRMTSSSG
jgi:hypothetical protein